MYLATVIDVYSRKLVGHALADHMRVSLVIEALSHARKAQSAAGRKSSGGACATTRAGGTPGATF